MERILVQFSDNIRQQIAITESAGMAGTGAAGQHGISLRSGRCEVALLSYELLLCAVVALHGWLR